MATMSARYTVIDGEIIAQERGGVRHQLVPDPLGSTVALYDDSGTKTDTFSYWPYGESTGRTGATTAKFQFLGSIGYYNDSDSSEYVRSRFFKKNKVRWLTEDSLIHINDLDRYSYCYNNPVSYFDFDGLQAKKPKPSKLDSKPVPGNWSCYRYSCGFSDYPYPGGPTDWDKVSDNCNALLEMLVRHEKVLKDKKGNIIKPGKNGKCPPGSHKIRAYFNKGNDFHFTREDLDGTWSDKHGNSPMEPSDSGIPTENIDQHCASRGRQLHKKPYVRCGGEMCSPGGPLQAGQVWLTR